ncbi:MAG: helix-turn-helix domain-containing protein [Verrucomicrobiota bacterium]|nr:helix-turn-helix domain-containing protein [Verrucomicrobiota bacterium]
MINPQLVRRDLFYMPLAGGKSYVSGGLLPKTSEKENLVNISPEHYSGIYLLQGSGWYTDAQTKKRLVQPGDFIQRVPGKKHTTIGDDTGTWLEFFISIDREYYNAMRHMQLLPEAPVVSLPLDLSLVNKMVKLLLDIKSGREASSVRVVSRVHEILCDISVLAMVSTTDAEHLDPIIPLAQELLSDPRLFHLSIPEIAKKTGVSYEAFRKKFLKCTGTTPGEFRLSAKMDLAKKLMVEDKKPIKEISDILAYPDVFCFSKQFKSRTGNSPGRFIAAAMG